MSEWTDPHNPFNSMKSLVHADRYETIMNGGVPAPVSVTIDPTNKCNLNCHWCHCGQWRKEDPSEAPDNALVNLARWLGRWKGLQSVCVAGGGEPTLHKDFNRLILELVSVDLSVSLITNGVNLSGDRLEAARRCQFVGFSVDAGTSETYKVQKGADRFGTVLNNMAALSKHPGQCRSIGYKFILQPDTLPELYIAAKMALIHGATEFHCRPLCLDGLKWSEDDIKLAKEEIERARSILECPDFHIYGITHKFNPNFGRKVPKACEVTPLAGLTFAADGWCYLCCDRRGDAEARMCKWEDAHDFWGGKKHRAMLKGLDTSLCHRRCTYVGYQEILDGVFREDKMFRKFI